MSHVVTASFHMSFPINCPAQVSRPVSGFVCGLDQRTLNKRRVTVPLICNPSTGQSLPLPKMKTRRKQVTSFLGYDPINKQFKVLCMIQTDLGPGDGLSGEHQVLTLEAGKKLSWRMIKYETPHWPDPTDYIIGDDRCIYNGIYINGVLYYLAFITWELPAGGFPDIVCFDVRYEKFSFIKKALQDTKVNYGGNKATLVSYKGKLAKLQMNKLVNHSYISIDLWVLDHAQKHQWSSYIYVLPRQLRNIFEESRRYVCEEMRDEGYH